MEASNQSIWSTLSLISIQSWTSKFPIYPPRPVKFPSSPHFSMAWPGNPTQMDSLQSLPPLSTLSTTVSSALNAKLGTNHDLTQAPSIVAEFLTQCDDLERNLVHLNRTLESNLASYASFSNRIGHLLGIVNSKLTDLGSSVSLRTSVSGSHQCKVSILILIFSSSSSSSFVFELCAWRAMVLSSSFFYAEISVL